ncbi:hypothetical protein SAMD00019534_068340 [Acytostelium subglobosum LB1]|uniref:hypothetical protein n=1 Tax=Acytostelium subglobosum LB1 TaxID=1410327 RepID=UPI000644B644|nr:hypothetical protein SAMD00019534_068340 [Acytostelium subglobosum LB1]GAM23659.1 hypothetical protein SAMD00019534_068340 [Acytostelium subglobosum LB1]|eukprot:XP_012753400.1 hypothetical protein SAMD00019534_068340 [Acytostelium subglobosum LB1]
MKNILKKAKDAYKSHFFLTQGVQPSDEDNADQIITDINPIEEPGPQGFLAFCDDPDLIEQLNNPNNNNPNNSHSSSSSVSTAASHTQHATTNTGLTTSSKSPETTPTKRTASTKLKPAIQGLLNLVSSSGRKDSTVVNTTGVNNNDKRSTQAAAGNSQQQPNKVENSEKKEEGGVERAPEREILYIKGLEDLPDDCLKLIKMSGLPEEKLRNNLQVLLYVLHFRTGKIIRIEGEPPKEPRKKFSSERFNDGDTLLAPVEHAQLKKLYKDPDQIGKGGFGTVYFARSTKEKKMVAIKKMPHVTKRQITQNFREASILSKCNHPNIVKLITCHLDKDQNMWLIMEFMEGGTFEEAAKAWKFNENNLAYVAKELLKGLHYLHTNGMVHRDLKSANIMMSVEGKVKLIDFGLCEDVSSGSPCHMVGSPFWMAPEMILGKPHSTPVDIWSFAISLLEMANQRPPMMESAVKAMFTVATEGAAGFDEPHIWSDTFKDFLAQCLRPDPEERATADQLLKHQFIRKADTRDNMENILKKIFLTNSLMNSGF